MNITSYSYRYVLSANIVNYSANEQRFYPYAHTDQFFLEMSRITVIYENASCRFLMCPSFTVMELTALTKVTLHYSLVTSSTCSLQNNAFSVLHYVIKLPYTTLCYIASKFIPPWNFRARLYYAAASQPRVFLLVGNKVYLDL